MEILRCSIWWIVVAAVQSLSVLWLCNPVDGNMPGLCVPYYLWVFPNSRLLSWWFYPTISPSAALFFYLQSFPASGSFPESVLCIRWPKYWSFSFSICPSNEYSGLIPGEYGGWVRLPSQMITVFAGYQRNVVLCYPNGILCVLINIY